MYCVKQRKDMVNFTRFDSIISLASYFSNEEICRQFLKEQRWGSVVVCPYCGSVHVYACGDGKRFKCDGCGNKFSVLVGTIFENTKLPLRKWFMAMYLLSSHKKGVSSHQIARDIEVTQKTAWFMLHKIRTLLGQEDNVTLADEVECDEAYMGGREKNKHGSKRTEATRGRSTKTKTPVFGMVQRGGKVVAKKVADTGCNTLSAAIRQYVKLGSRIFTDEWIGYKTLKESEYKHDFVRHNVKEFVNGDIYTNTIEGFWGQLKRMIIGVYHFTSAKYLQRYVDEAVFRYNTCRCSEGERFSLMMRRSAAKFDYYDVVNMAA